MFAFATVLVSVFLVVLNFVFVTAIVVATVMVASSTTSFCS